MKNSHNHLSISQNFFKNPSYVRYLISLSSVCDQDHILEIGAGSGVITEELAKAAQHVIALEIDKVYFEQVQARVRRYQNVTCKRVDFMRYQLPDEAYKVFANIPFSITAEIIDKLLGSSDAPNEAFLIMQREAADKFVVQSGSTEASALWQPWYEFEILAEIDRTQFQPVPSVDAALLSIRKRRWPLLKGEPQPDYGRFVSFGFRAWKKDLKTAYKQVFTHVQWKRLAKQGRFAQDAKPSDLTPEQWAGLFNYYQVGVSAEKKKRLAANS